MLFLTADLTGLAYIKCPGLTCTNPGSLDVLGLSFAALILVLQDQAAVRREGRYVNGDSVVGQGGASRATTCLF